jgi:hypothetical protein
MQRILLCSSIVAATLLAGCATSYSQLTGARYHRVPIDTYPVAVLSVDGKASPLRSPILIEPGMRQITVQGPPSSGLNGPYGTYGDRQTFTLDVKPCTHYWLVAVKPNRLSNEFTPKVDYAEPIAGCTPPAGT